jgi:predicted molibdopterin-dependent oxidoreductase YjgC
MVKVSSNRGFIKAVAVVTKRIKALRLRRQEGAHRRHSDPLGLQGGDQAGFMANTLTPFVGDANTQTPEYKAFLVNIEKAKENCYGMQSLDIKQRSATTTPSPPARQTVEVAKLIDVSKCIGCKACQVACMEWNDLRDEVGTCTGVYDNPIDLTDNSWT